MKEKKTMKSLLKKITENLTLKNKTDKKKNKEKEIQKKKEIPAPFKILMCITLTGIGDKIVNFLTENGVILHALTRGLGTASNSRLETLGITTNERDVIFALIQTEKVEEIIQKIDEMNKKNTYLDCFYCVLKPSSAELNLINLIMGE